MKEKVEKSELKGMDQELKKQHWPRETRWQASTAICAFCHDFVTQNTAGFRLFLVRALSDDFEHALQKKVPKMLCQYPRKQFRANEHTENSNLKTSLNMQPENAISQCCSVKESDQKSHRKGLEFELEKAALSPWNAFPRKCLFKDKASQENHRKLWFYLVFLLFSLIENACSQ